MGAGLLGRLRLWIAMHEHATGLLIMIAVTLPLIAILTFLILPQGASETVEGRLMSFSIVETEQGSRRTALVDVDGRMGRVTVPLRMDCAVGDRIRVERRRTVLGQRFKTAYDPRPCSRT